MKKILYYLLPAASLLAAAGCGDADDWTPGPEPAEDCMAVYFGSGNTSEYILTPDDPTRIELEVFRRDADRAASVPLVIVHKDDVFQIPQTVEFAAGETSSLLEISFPGLEQRTVYSFEIRIDEAYVDHYAMLDGTSLFAGSVLVASWIKIADQAEFYFQSDLDVICSDILQLEGQNRYVIENFLGSGLDLTFSVSEPDSYGSCAVYPTSNYVDIDGSSWHSWELYDDEADDWPEFTPPGSDITLTYVSFYGYDDSGFYTYINFDDCFAQFAGWLGYADGWSGYNYIYVYWDAVE